MNFLEISGLFFWALITLYVFIVVRLWWIRINSGTIEMDKPSSIHAGNITVANGFKCSKCGLIRPYWMNDCICNRSVEDVN